MRAQAPSGGYAGLRFKTDRELLERMLPPGFEFVEPLAQIDFGGSLDAGYWARALVRARFEDVDGWLPVGLWTSSERELLVARERHGLGAQPADITVSPADGGGYTARIAVDGELTLELTVGPDEGEERREGPERLLFPAFTLDPDWTRGPFAGPAEVRSLAWGPGGGFLLAPDSVRVVWKTRRPLAPASELPIVKPVLAFRSDGPSLDSDEKRAAAIGSAELNAWAPLRYRRPSSQGRLWRPQGWPDEATAARFSDAEIRSLRGRKETQLSRLEIVTVDAMISRETHEALLPPACRGAGRPMIKVLGMRVNDGDDVAVAHDELWLFAFSIVAGRAAWYMLSHVVGPGGDIVAGRETFGYPSRRGEPEVVVTPIDCSVSGSRKGREFVYVDGTFQGFATGVSLDQIPVVGLRMKPGSRTGELVYQQWTFQGRRYRMNPRTIGLEFPASDGRGRGRRQARPLVPTRAVPHGGLFRDGRRGHAALAGQRHRRGRRPGVLLPGALRRRLALGNDAQGTATAVLPRRRHRDQQLVTSVSVEPDRARDRLLAVGLH